MHAGDQDPHKARLIEKLRKKGIAFAGMDGMSVEQLENLEGAMREMGPGQFHLPGEFRTPGDGGGVGKRASKEEL